MGRKDGLEAACAPFQLPATRVSVSDFFELNGPGWISHAHQVGNGRPAAHRGNAPASCAGDRWWLFRCLTKEHACDATFVDSQLQF